MTRRTILFGMCLTAGGALHGVRTADAQGAPQAASLAGDKATADKAAADKAAADKDSPDKAAAEGESQTPTVKVTRGAGGEKVYRITEGIVIEGKIQKPEAFYVLQRSNINYDWEGLKKSFIPKLLDSVKRSPF